MADPVLHIKDSYFFEVPKVLYPYEFKSRKQFPDVWISLDPEFQDWEAGRLIAAQVREAGLPPQEQVLSDWHHWVHADHANFAKPLREFLNEKYQQQLTKFNTWKASEISAAVAKKDGSDLSARKLDFGDYLKHEEAVAPTGGEYDAFLSWRHEKPEVFHRTAREARNITEWKLDEHVPEWSKEKLAAYNWNLSGKIIIPQPFGTLRNLHEAESTIIDPQTVWINRQDFGFCISRFMLIEVAVGLVVLLLFSWLAGRLASRKPPQGMLWNLLEVFFVFIRDQVARPALDTQHDDGHAEHGPEKHGHADVHGDHHGHSVPAHAHAAHAVHHENPSDRYTPVLCTIFFFILGCNLAGMLPWVGSPTGTWGVTLALAMVTLLVGFIGGVREFGLGGYFLNQIPSMDLAWPMALVLKPIIFVIELGGLLIKHAVLSVRLLANMLAGHMVLLAIMGLAFGSVAAGGFIQADGSISPMWWVAAISSVVGCTLLSLLELFVAFLQAYVFTLLSALFIGAAIHKH